MSTIGEKIRAARTRLGIGQRELSRRSGVSAASLSEIERGLRDPRYATLDRIATALDVEVSSLVAKPRRTASKHRQRRTIAAIVEAAGVVLDVARVAAGDHSEAEFLAVSRAFAMHSWRVQLREDGVSVEFLKQRPSPKDEPLVQLQHSVIHQRAFVSHVVNGVFDVADSRRPTPPQPLRRDVVDRDITNVQATLSKVDSASDFSDAERAELRAWCEGTLALYGRVEIAT
jgi:transcriptional regulator with XRE-family HTH domain